jgi:hypothetical protein
MDEIVSGQNNLRNALTSCDDPLKAIEAFQVRKFIFAVVIIIFTIHVDFSVSKRDLSTVTQANATSIGFAHDSSAGLPRVCSR